MPEAYQSVAQRYAASIAQSRYQFNNPTVVNIDSKIEKNAQKQALVHTFPNDLPKHYFEMIQYPYNPLGFSEAEQFYRLPLPIDLVDSKTINYTDGFNIVGSLASLGAQGIFGNAVREITQVAGAVAQLGNVAIKAGGLSINNLNLVTLDLPSFQKFNLTFNLAPKTREESEAINNIIFNLKKYSHPEGEETTGFNLILRFPRFFFLCFRPSPEYLYKFKPCVIENITVNYNPRGGVGFYKTSSIGMDNLSIPESVLLQIHFRELEVWLQHNFVAKSSTVSSPTGNPADAISRNWIGF